MGFLLGAHPNLWLSCFWIFWFYKKLFLQELHYFNGKYLRGLNLTFDPSFGVPVNFNASIVHIPTEVYDRGKLHYSGLWNLFDRKKSLKTAMLKDFYPDYQASFQILDITKQRGITKLFILSQKSLKSILS